MAEASVQPVPCVCRVRTLRVVIRSAANRRAGRQSASPGGVLPSRARTSGPYSGASGLQRTCLDIGNRYACQELGFGNVWGQEVSDGKDVLDIACIPAGVRRSVPLSALRTGSTTSCFTG